MFNSNNPFEMFDFQKVLSATKLPKLESIVAQIPVGRLADPKEIASLVSYLCSDEAAFMTGATLNINGGQHYQ